MRHVSPARVRLSGWGVGPTANGTPRQGHSCAVVVCSMAQAWARCRQPTALCKGLSPWAQHFVCETGGLSRQHAAALPSHAASCKLRGAPHEPAGASRRAPDLQRLRLSVCPPGLPACLPGQAGASLIAIASHRIASLESAASASARPVTSSSRFWHDGARACFLLRAEPDGDGTGCCRLD